MALAAPHVRLGYGSLHLLAESADLHALLKQSTERPHHRRTELQKLTRISLQDAGHRAILAQATVPLLPRGSQQTAFFAAAPTVVVPIEVLAFLSSWCSHFTHSHLTL